MARSADPSSIGRLGFLLAVAAILLTPLLVQLVGGSASQSENRRLAGPPSFPRAETLAQWPRQVDAYLDDHFGLRPQMVGIAARLRWNLLQSSPNPVIVRGRGRTYFSEDEVPFQTLLSTCGALWAEPQLAQFSRDLTKGLERLRDLLPAARVLVVPTAAVLYPEQLPRWMGRVCAGRIPLAEELLNRLPGGLRQGIAYPRDLTATLPDATPLVPLNNFHWQGAGIHAFLGQFAERELHLTRHASPIWADQVMESDLAVYVPGVKLSNRVRIADWTEAGVRGCTEAACTGTAPLEGVALPSEMLRLQRPGSGGRMLVVGDSFVAGAADALIGFASDVITLNLNNLPHLPPDEQRLLWERITAVWRPDRVLMVVNDGNLTALARFVEAIASAAGR
jgi:hypothetical protein